MRVQNLKSLLLVGLDLVGLARSARAAGFRVYAADYFGDYDLMKICEICRAIVDQKAGMSCGRFEDNFSPEKFIDLVKTVLKETSIDAILLSSGLDDSFEVLETLNELAPILGNKPETFRKIRDESKFFRELKRLNLPHPETIVVESFEDAKRAAKDIGYPVIVKPSRGFAGIGIRKAANSNELKKCFEVASFVDGKVIVQEYIAGVNASISFVSSTDEAKILTVNEQLLGLKEVGQQEPFGFCGNIVPLAISSETFQKCYEAVKKLSLHFRLLGSNGIDFVLSGEGKPYVIEVNPRFQATIECVEQALGLNLVKLHVEACLNGRLPNIPRKNDEYYVRLILYSKNRVRVKDLTGLRWARDIPFPGVIIEEGEPICSVIAKANGREQALKEVLDKAKLVYESMTEPV